MIRSIERNDVDRRHALKASCPGNNDSRLSRMQHKTLNASYADPYGVSLPEEVASQPGSARERHRGVAFDRDRHRVGSRPEGHAAGRRASEKIFEHRVGGEGFEQSADAGPTSERAGPRRSEKVFAGGSAVAR